MNLPLVTCIMPTADRPDFVRQAIKLFVSQTYRGPKRLVIVEDGESNCASLVTAHSLEARGIDHTNAQIIEHRHLGLERYSIGEKRNIACQIANSDEFYSGDIIAHWDDDDWHSPTRLSTQMHAMFEANARICGADRLVFYDGTDAYLYQSVRPGWLAGGTLMYEKSLWRELGGFQNKSSGEDTAFVDAAVRAGAKVATIHDESLYVAMLHGKNTELRQRDSQWGGYEADKVKKWMEART